MSQSQGNGHEPDEAEEQYPLSPPGPAAADYQPQVYPRYGVPPDEGPPPEEPFQFTLAELFWLITGVAIVLAIVGCIPGGYSVEMLAGLAGLGLLVSLVVLTVVQPTRPILRVAWCVLLAFYVLASLVALVRSLL